MFGGRQTEIALEPFGVIDIGSNSVRLVVYEGAVRAATPIFNEKVLCGLGKSVATTNRLGEDAIQKALEALRRFRAVALILKVKNMRVLATAAVREAANGEAFIRDAEKALGARIDVLSGAEEAELAAAGIRMGFMNPDGLAGDLGGGSLEIIDIHPDQVLEGVTLPLGGLRLVDQTGGKIELALPIADEMIAKVKWLTKGRGRPFYAVGGTWRALAKLHMEHIHYPMRVMQGYTIPTREAIEFCQAVRRVKKPSLLPGIEDVARARRDILPFGALVLERLLEAMAPSEVVFSVYGIREGLVYSLLPSHEKKKDPLISFCEGYAETRSRSLDHARELCTWTDAIFQGDGPKETPEERRLRHAACLMSDIGWRAHPDYRGEQSLNVIAHSGLAGIDHAGRMFLGLSIFYRHTGGEDDRTDELSARLRAAISKRMLKRARIVGAAVRTAHMLSIGMPGVIDEAPLSMQGGKLVLTLPKVYAALNGERLQRRLSHLAGLVERQSEVRILS